MRMKRIGRRTPRGAVRAVVAGLCFSLAAAGCAGLGQRLEPPQISLADIRVAQAAGMETAFELQLRVFNTNARDLRVTGIDCALEINERRFATGVSRTAITVPSYGSELVSVTLYSSVFNMLRSAWRLQHSDQLSYRLQGRLRLAEAPALSAVLPFAAEGKVSLDDLTPRRSP